MNNTLRRRHFGRKAAFRKLLRINWIQSKDGIFLEENHFQGYVSTIAKYAMLSDYGYSIMEKCQYIFRGRILLKSC